MSRIKFRYPLEPLLRKRRADWEIVRVEEATAGKIVDSRSGEVDKARGTVEEAEKLLRDARRDGSPIDVARQTLLAAYLTQQRDMFDKRKQAFEQARKVHEKVKSSLETIARGVKSLEKHRTGREIDHRFEQSIVEQKHVDELWLLRWPNKGDDN